MFLQKLCDHGDNVLRRQRDQQLLPQLQHRHAATHDLQISKTSSAFPPTWASSVPLTSVWSADLWLIPSQGSLIANMILGIIILKKRSVFFLWHPQNLEITPFRDLILYGMRLKSVFFFSCRYSASKYLSIALVSVGIFICTIMSAKQVVSTPGSRTALVMMLPETTQTSSPRVNYDTTFCVFIPHDAFCKNVASEGSEERSVHAFMHWLIGELWVRSADREVVVDVSGSIQPARL